MMLIENRGDFVYVQKKKRSLATRRSRFEDFCSCRPGRARCDRPGRQRNPLLYISWTYLPRYLPILGHHQHDAEYMVHQAFDIDNQKVGIALDYHFEEGSEITYHFPYPMALLQHPYYGQDAVQIMVHQ